MPNEFSGQIVVEKDGFKEIHIIKDGKAIQKYNVRVYPDGREVSVDDEFAVVAVQDGQKVTNGLGCNHTVSRTRTGTGANTWTNWSYGFMV